MDSAAEQPLIELRNQLSEAADEGQMPAGELLGHVDSYLATSEPSTGEHGTFLERLSHGASHFEVTHPRLSATLSQVIDALTAAGI